MTKRRWPERTAPGNPHELTIRQHIHSKANIARFVDGRGMVGVLERTKSAPYPAKSDADCFCALRVWDQRLERSKATVEIETGFLDAAKDIIRDGSVAAHAAVTSYFLLWKIRARLAADPPEDVELAIDVSTLDGSRLKKDEEELLESKHVVFMRDSDVPGRSKVPGRLFASLRAFPELAEQMDRYQGERWGVWRARDGARFLCPDNPGNEFYMPLTPTLALAARNPDQDLGVETVDALNQSAYASATRLIFGRPEDVRRFARRNQSA